MSGRNSVDAEFENQSVVQDYYSITQHSPSSVHAKLRTLDNLFLRGQTSLKTGLNSHKRLGIQPRR